ncbi:extracellular solute-binding protein [Streptomyces sp. NPDC004610]|uniref:ABC transporter substrate-binding protein n=1 Tax=unclassified Streptomyces TaxID=2593676 RepID=UPI0033B2C272
MKSAVTRVTVGTAAARRVVGKTAARKPPVRRRTLRAAATVAVTALLATALTACGDSGRVELVLYQSLSPTQIKPIAEGFERYYRATTGHEVEVSAFHQSGGDLRATLGLEARADAVQADVVITDSSDLTALQERAPGLFERLDLPETRDPHLTPAVRSVSTGANSVVTGLQPYVIAYNTDRVSPADVPRSWADLLRPRFEHRIGMGDPETTNGAHVPLWFLTERLARSEGAPYGWEYYRRLGALGPRTAGSHDAVMAYIAQGELDAGILGYGTVAQSAADGNPVAAVLPAEGAGALAIGTAVVADGEQRHIGRMFTRWIVGPEGQAAVYEGTGYLPVRDDVPVGRPPFPIDLDVGRIAPIDTTWVATHRSANIARFREEIG